MQIHYAKSKAKHSKVHSMYDTFRKAHVWNGETTQHWTLWRKCHSKIYLQNTERKAAKPRTTKKLKLPNTISSSLLMQIISFMHHAHKCSCRQRASFPHTLPHHGIKSMNQTLLPNPSYDIVSQVISFYSPTSIRILRQVSHQQTRQCHLSRSKSRLAKMIGPELHIRRVSHGCSYYGRADV